MREGRAKENGRGKEGWGLQKHYSIVWDTCTCKHVREVRQLSQNPSSTSLPPGVVLIFRFTRTPNIVLLRYSNSSDIVTGLQSCVVEERKWISQHSWLLAKPNNTLEVSYNDQGISPKCSKCYSAGKKYMSTHLFLDISYCTNFIMCLFLYYRR